jgi:hypothetical protein
MPCTSPPARPPPPPPSASPHLNLEGLVFNIINKKFLLRTSFSDEVFYRYRLKKIIIDIFRFDDFEIGILGYHRSFQFILFNE